jgi:HAD superfamily hydrolase (TIGR01509 family)
LYAITTARFTSSRKDSVTIPTPAGYQVTTMPFAAVVFDLDGTLIDTEATYRRAFMAAAAEFHFRLPRGFYESLVGIASCERGPLLRHEFGASFPVDAFLAAYYTHRAALMPARIPVRTGAMSLLRQLRRPKAVATSASRATALAHITRAGLSGHFTYVVTRDDVAHGKPAPDSFLRAAELLDVPPEACLAVEDSANGVLAALAAGMPVVMVARRPRTDLARCCVGVVDGLPALERLLHRRRPETPPRQGPQPIGLAT